MRIGVGLDSRLGLSVSQLRDLAPRARALGYDGLWTNASLDYDPLALCHAWHAASGLATGVAVVPIARVPAAVLALAARTVHALTGGTFTLGIGSGAVAERPVEAVRSYLRELRGIAPDVPVLVGALGPRMLRLAGGEANGAALNWCTPAQVAWSRERAGPGAALVSYLRVAVDDDVAAARGALAAQILAYALVPPSGASGYPRHFARMGFGEELAYLGERRDAGASDAELVRAVPERLLGAFGYAGRGDGAREWLQATSAGLDVAVVRVLTPRPGDLTPVRAAMEAFAPRP